MLVTLISVLQIRSLRRRVPSPGRGLPRGGGIRAGRPRECWRSARNSGVRRGVPAAPEPVTRRGTGVGAVGTVRVGAGQATSNDRSRAGDLDQRVIGSLALADLRENRLALFKCHHSPSWLATDRGLGAVSYRTRKHSPCGGRALLARLEERSHGRVRVSGPIVEIGTNGSIPTHRPLQ